MKTRKSKGITLISLVVTIIILIILAGISIHLVLGESGILSKAKYAKEKYLNEHIFEEESLEKLYDYLINGEFPENTKDTDAGTIVALPDNWYTTTPNHIETQTGEIVKRSTKVTSVYAVATGNGETVPVPIGFYYVGGTISSGVVISDDPNDQNKYKDKTDVPAGVTYNDDGTVNEEESELKGNQFVWIPCTIENYKKINWGDKYTNAVAWETQTNSAELPQIKKYGGFYVGRYEAGTSEIELLVSSTKVDFSAQNTGNNGMNDNFSIRDKLSDRTISGTITSKAGEIPYYYADYETALKLSNSMYNTDYVQSGLITGTMWDAMLNFIAEGTNSVVTTESYWGNFANSNITYIEGRGRYATVDSKTGSVTSAFQTADASYHCGIRTTASTEEVKKKNLYDVAGNLDEWIQEMSYTSWGKMEAYMIRGMSFVDDYSSFPVCYRGAGPATETYIYYGFRPALFIM